MFYVYTKNCNICIIYSYLLHVIFCKRLVAMLWQHRRFVYMYSICSDLCCIKWLNFDLLCSVNLMLHQIHCRSKQYVRSTWQALIMRVDTTCWIVWYCLNHTLIIYSSLEFSLFYRVSQKVTEFWTEITPEIFRQENHLGYFAKLEHAVTWLDKKLFNSTLTCQDGVSWINHTKSGANFF